jgi:hypothetical protein
METGDGHVQSPSSKEKQGTKSECNTEPWKVLSP